MISMALVACLGWWVVALRLGAILWRIGLLPQHRLAKLPSLSVVIAARDEEANLQAALQSLLSVDYPELQVILVNDRSQDATGAIMNSLAAVHPQVEVVQVEELPEGWLGKNHALQCGARRARGEWLLFSDADIHFGRDCLLRAVTTAEQRGLDHLVLGPQMVCGSFGEKIFVGFFGMAFCLRFRPDLVGRPNDYSVGVGAFNLLRRSVYQAIGGHSSLAYQVLDDMVLGRRIKQRGYRQGFVAAGPCLKVRWCIGWSGLFRGLEKNAYAGLDYSPWRVALACLVTAWVSLAPLWLVTQGEWGWGLLGYLAQILCGAGLAACGSPLWGGLFFPCSGLLFCAILLRACLLCHWRGGIVWRGRFYSLKELKKQSRS